MIWIVPDDLRFGDLRLTRNTDGGISFERAPLVEICEASGLNPVWLDDEDAAGGMIAGWYDHHLALGGDPDATMEDLRIEIAAGMGSLAPG